MPLYLDFDCSLAHGLHARPASMLEEVARRFPAVITLRNERTGLTANLKSVLAIVGTDTRHNDRCRVAIDGERADDALAAISTLVRERLPTCDAALPRDRSSASRLLPLSPVLRDSGSRIVRGVPGVPGIGAGQIVRHSTADLPIDGGTAEIGSHPAAEESRLEEALAAVLQDYDRVLAGPLARTEAEIVAVHRAIARDPVFGERLRESVRCPGGKAGMALLDAEQHFSRLFGSSGNPVLEERALDVHDVCRLLLRHLNGASPAVAAPLVRASILLADSLTPAGFLALDRRYLGGIALAHGGPTSHTVILAGSFGIPTLLGVAGLHDPALQGEAVLDAESGVLVVAPTPGARRYYVMESSRLAARREKIRDVVQAPGRTRDGVPLSVHANIVDAAETSAMNAAGAEGVGLFRTEALFLDRQAPPGEDEQQAAFAATVAGAGGRPVVFRTLDAASDKHLACLDLPGQENPFASRRGPAAYALVEPLFRSHLRALLRAAQAGAVHILVPMISEMPEVHWVKRVIAEEHAALVAQGSAARMPPLGAMIETPAAVALMDELCGEFDFFSIGSNDLLQFFSGSDRARVGTMALDLPLEPGFLALLKHAADTARRHGRPIGLCGELAADSELLALIVGLQLDSVSMSLSAIPRTKAILPRLSFHDCSTLLTEALGLGTAGAVRTLLSRRASLADGPLIDPNLVIVDADVTSKAEALKAICDRLFQEGRTARPHELERAVWERELAYSTGVGNGVAIPHCRSTALGAPALAVLKPQRPLEWGSSDGEPVRLVLFLGIDGGADHASHMRILATLARRLMHADFSQGLQDEQNPEAVAELIRNAL